MTWVYRRHRDGVNYLYTVGYYVPYVDSDANSDIGRMWEPIEDFNNEGDARKMVHYLNGGDS
jgi:hypothetical protein